MAQRRKFVAGNWKMNTLRSSAVSLAREVDTGVRSVGAGVDVALCPPLVYVEAVGAALRSAGSRVWLGAQTCSSEASGAFTGEMSGAMLVDMGCRCVIAGHSERRHILGESDEVVSKKVRAGLAAGLHVILCVGETLAQREAGQTDQVNERQVRSGLLGLEAAGIANLTIAYEPVWAIGTGKTAKAVDAQAAHAHIRSVVQSVAGAEAAGAMRIQYGGSMKPENAAELMAQPDVDGGLIGGAALKAAEFLAIVRAAG